MGHLSKILIPSIYENVSQNVLRKNIEITRIAFGLVSLVRAIDLAGALILFEDSWWVFSLGIILFAFLTVGFLTPICLILLIFFVIPHPVGWSLNSMIQSIVCWSLLFLNAGTSISFDQILQKKGRFVSPLIEFFRGLVGGNLIVQFGWVRIVALTLYSSICLAAMAFHFDDRFWIEGHTLPLLFTTPYFTDWYDYTSKIASDHTIFFGSFLKLSLFVQSIWELLLFPIFFLKYVRWFTILQGFAFFIVSIIFINLSYLPWTELLLWNLLFFPNIYLFLKGNFDEGKDVRSSPLTLTTRVFVGVSILTASVFALTQFYPSDFWAQKLDRRLVHKKYLGLYPVEVLNKSDLEMGTHALVIAEMSQGDAIRIVPFMDHRGGRLSYIRSDAIYFSNSLIYQRAPPQRKFLLQPKFKESDVTRWLAQRISIFDLCLNSHSTGHYRVFLFENEFRPLSDYYVNAGSIFLGSFDLMFSRSELEEIRSMPDCENAFRFNIGHLFEAKRTEETLSRIKDLSH